MPRQACGKGGVSPQQVAQAIALRRLGWGKNIYMYKFEPGLSPGFLWQKADPGDPQKVHVGF
ncbi:hypothetical protein ACP0HM_25040 [Escherichia coli]